MFQGKVIYNIYIYRSIMCLTEHLSWVLGWLAMYTWPDHKVHWWPLLWSLPMPHYAPVRWWSHVCGFGDIYWCPILSGLQWSWLWWLGTSLQRALVVPRIATRGTPLGHHIIVTGIFFLMHHCFAPCVNVWVHMCCKYLDKHNFKFDFNYIWKYRMQTVGHLFQASMDVINAN